MELKTKFRRQEMNKIKLEETRREFLVRSAQGLGTMALASLLSSSQQTVSAESLEAEHWRGVLDPLHFVPRAKRIIYLYQAGGSSLVDLWDYKSSLESSHGQKMPESLTRGQQMTTMTSGQRLTIMKPQYPFSRFGKSFC